MLRFISNIRVLDLETTISCYHDSGIYILDLEFRQETNLK